MPFSIRSDAHFPRFLICTLMFFLITMLGDWLFGLSYAETGKRSDKEVHDDPHQTLIPNDKLSENEKKQVSEDFSKVAPAF